MDKATLIIPDPTTRVPVAYNLNISDAVPAKLPQALVGPFRFSFVMDDSSGHSDQFEAIIHLSSNRVFAMFNRYPILAKFGENAGYTLRGTSMGARMRETHHEGDFMLMALDPTSLGHNISHIWVDINQGFPLAGTCSVKDKKVYCLPYYNFYNHLELCLGHVNLEGKILNQLYTLLSAGTTPHGTWQGARHNHWHHDLEKRTITVSEDSKPRIDLADHPVLWDTSPIAQIAP